MLGVLELVLVALLVVVAALVLRMRQHEPAAIERLGRRLDEARAELAAAEARVAAIRDELATGDRVLEPLRADRAELDVEVAERRAAVADAVAELARVRADIAGAQAAREAEEQALAEQRAQRAEVEAALRDARARLAQEPDGAPAAVRRRSPVSRGTVDLAAIASSGRPGPAEPPIVTTGGAVRPTEAMPDHESPSGGPGHAGEEQSP